MYIYNCTVLRVVDGDTVWCRIDLGFYTFVEVPVRLAGINAPELDTPEGKLSREYLRALVDGHKLTIATHKTEKYGRWLGTLTFNGINLSEAMVAQGKATRYTP